ncbi:hypothetical protein Goshw_022192 [Gossypium schwendimanii]|uniref:DUF4228 domain protein n=1 Tax=Gossypium schwendimanii TaxID=34291 RepID=A0A7J9LQ87_GOSSC|nr:hypothetical protein [Gossypium schwendimanii]
MGIKILNPWWFRLLRNHFSCLHRHLHHHHHHHEPPRTIKVINCDGVVKIYDRPVHVSELLIEFPKHMICRSDSFYIGQKIPPLSMDDKLHFGHDYFLLPQQAFQSALSFVTIASFANARYSSSRESGNAMLKKAAACQPFHIEKSASGCLRLRVSDEFIRQLMEESNVKQGSGDKGCSRICTTPQLQKQYASLVGSRHWKPTLETIKEKKKRRRRISFGMKRKNKSVLKNNVKSHRSSSQQHHGDVITCAKPQSKPKIKSKIKSSRKL